MAARRALCPRRLMCEVTSSEPKRRLKRSGLSHVEGLPAGSRRDGVLFEGGRGSRQVGRPRAGDVGAVDSAAKLG